MAEEVGKTGASKFELWRGGGVGKGGIRGGRAGRTAHQGSCRVGWWYTS
jgi:hypothetical protein